MPTITYPISHPTTPGFTEITWNPRSTVGRTESPFTYDTKKYVWDGKARSVTIKLPQMGIADAKLWQAFFLKLNGKEGSFYLRDTVGKVLRGGAINDPAPDGWYVGTAGSGPGNEVLVHGFTTAIGTGAFKAGDWISIADRLYTVLDDADESSAECTVTVWPELRVNYPHETEILIGADARGIFELLDFPEWAWNIHRLMSGVSFTAQEVL